MYRFSGWCVELDLRFSFINLCSSHKQTDRLSNVFPVYMAIDFPCHEIVTRISMRLMNTYEFDYRDYVTSEGKYLTHYFSWECYSCFVGILHSNIL